MIVDSIFYWIKRQTPRMYLRKAFFNFFINYKNKWCNIVWRGCGVAQGAAWLIGCGARRAAVRRPRVRISARHPQWRPSTWADSDEETRAELDKCYEWMCYEWMCSAWMYIMKKHNIEWPRATKPLILFGTGSLHCLSKSRLTLFSLSETLIQKCTDPFLC
jgi:hypothetical protein